MSFGDSRLEKSCMITITLKVSYVKKIFFIYCSALLFFYSSLKRYLIYVNLSLRNFTLVKLEGFCRVYGPQTVYCLPRGSNRDVIGLNWGNFSRRDGSFSRFPIIFIWFATFNYIACGKDKYVGFLVYFIFFVFHRNSNFAPKSRAVIGLMSGWKIGGPSCVVGFYFLGKILQQFDSPCKTVCQRVFLAKKDWFINFKFVFGGSPQMWYCERRSSFVSCLCFDILTFTSVCTLQ